MSLARYIIDVSKLSSIEIEEMLEKINLYAYNSSHDIPVTKFDAFFRASDNIEVIKAQFPSRCIFIRMSHS